MEMMGRVAVTLSALRIVTILQMAGVEISGETVEAAVSAEIGDVPMRADILETVEGMLDDVLRLQSRFGV